LLQPEINNRSISSAQICRFDPADIVPPFPRGSRLPGTSSATKAVLPTELLAPGRTFGRIQAANRHIRPRVWQKIAAERKCKPRIRRKTLDISALSAERGPKSVMGRSWI
jgi:hypothetical protein